MQKKHLPVLLGLVLVVAGCGTKALTPLPERQILTGQTLNQADANFVTAAYQIVQLDNQEGQLALVQASDPRVRAFASDAIGKANALYPRLEDAIRVNGIAPPTRLPGALERKVNALRALQGGAFDRAYLADQIESHQHAATVFQAEQTRTQDPKMREMADTALPVVQAGLARLQEIAATVR